MIKVAEFLGLVNTMDPLQAPEGSLAVADNVDVDSSKQGGGSIHRRSGYTALEVLNNVTSAYATKDQTRLYVIANGELLSFNEDMSHSLVMSGLAEGEYYWEEVGEKVYYNGPSSGIITQNTFRPWGVATAPQPNITALSGSLPEGRYMATCVFRNGWGEEGGAPPSALIEVEADTALRIEVPQLDSHTTVVYLTTNNGKQLYKLTETNDPFVIFDGPLEMLVAPLSTQQFQTNTLPERTYNLAHFDGRMYVPEYDPQNDITFIYKSQIYWLGLYDLYADFLQISGEVRCLKAYTDGLLIGTDREVISYHPDRGMTLLATYGVPLGQQATCSPTGIVYFWTDRGLCRVPEFLNLTEARFSPPPGDRCSAAFIEQDGYNKVIVSTTDSGTPNNNYS